MFPTYEPSARLPVPTPLRQQPFADRLVAPYRTGPWSAGTMVFFAFLIVPLFSAIGAVSLGDYLTDGAERSRRTALGGLVIAVLPAAYLAIASVINAIRFGHLRAQVAGHYGWLASLTGRDPRLDIDLGRVLGDDGELWREDRRRHVLRRIGAVLSFIAALVSLASGDVTTSDSGFEKRGPRAGQFGHKLFWGLLVIGGGTAAIVVVHREASAVAVMAGVYLAVNLLWWLPSLWRSRALRRVDQEWRTGAAAVCARLPMPMPGWCAPKTSSTAARATDAAGTH